MKFEHENKRGIGESVQVLILLLHISLIANLHALNTLHGLQVYVVIFLCERRQYLATSMNDNNLRKTPNLYCGHLHVIIYEG